MPDRFVKYVGSLWHQICLCVKVLAIAAVLFVIVQLLEVVALYVSVNSGGLNTVSANIFVLSGVGLMGFFLVLLILIPIAFIMSLVKMDEPINGLLTVIAVAIAVASFEGRFYLRDDVLKLKPEPDTMRCVNHNTKKAEALRKVGTRLTQLRNTEDLVLTEDLSGLGLTGFVPPLVNSKFVLNVNLLNRKSSELPDDVVVVFESNVPHDGGNIGGPSDISTWWYYGRGSLMVFGDGRVEFVKTEDFNNLRWRP